MFYVSVLHMALELLECFPFVLLVFSEEELKKKQTMLFGITHSVFVSKMSLLLDKSKLKHRLALLKLTQADFPFDGSNFRLIHHK
jgi:hypothetical protein